MLWSDFLNDDMEHGHLISGLMTTWFICCFCSYSMSCVDQRDRGHRWLRVAPRRGHREVRAQPRQVRTRGQDGPPLGGMAMGWQWDGNVGFRASKDGTNLEIWWNANGICNEKQFSYELVELGVLRKFKHMIWVYLGLLPGCWLTWRLVSGIWLRNSTWWSWMRLRWIPTTLGFQTCACFFDQQQRKKWFWWWWGFLEGGWAFMYVYIN